MEITKLSEEEVIEEIKGREDFMLSNFRVLRKADPNDHYWRNFLELDAYIRDGEIFEPGMVINWIGSRFSPKTILEIGTRSGGSLINLLTPYRGYDDLDIVSFDLWKEYFSATWMSRVLTNIIGSADGKTQRNISQKYTRIFSGVIKYFSTSKVRRNLKYFNIPPDKIQFISGDSRVTVPDFFKKNPNKKFDYVLVDGAHDPETAMIDLQNVVDCIKTGGFLVFDDIGPEGYNLKEVWESFKKQHEDKFIFYERYHRKGVAWAIRIAAI